MKKYPAILKERLYAAKLKRWVFSPQVFGITYGVISEMIDETGPMLAEDVSRIFCGVFCVTKKDFSQRVLKKNNHMSEHGIQIATLDEAVSRVHEDYDKISAGTKRVNARVKLLYKTPESLDQYIRQHTEVRIIRAIHCTFPRYEA